VGFGLIISGRGGRKSIANTRQIRLFGCACLCVCPSYIVCALEEGGNCGWKRVFGVGGYLCPQCIYTSCSLSARVDCSIPKFRTGKNDRLYCNICHLYVIFVGAHDGPFSQIYSRPSKIILCFPTLEKRE